MLEQSANSASGHDEPVEIPIDHKLRLERCPKCGYERQDTDDGYVSSFECPQCGVMYALAMEEVRRRNQGQELQDQAEAYASRSQGKGADRVGSMQVGGAFYVSRARSGLWFYVCLGVGVAALAGWFLL